MNTQYVYLVVSAGDRIQDKFTTLEEAKRYVEERTNEGYDFYIAKLVAICEVKLVTTVSKEWKEVP